MKTGKVGVCLLTILLAQVLFLGNALAETPQNLRSQADAHAQTATQLMLEGQKLLNSARGIESLRAAISLYAQAGSRFEKATQIYRNLVPDYATQADVDNSESAMRLCFEMIQKIKTKA